MEKFKDILSKISLYSIVIPLLAGFVGGFLAIYVAPAIDQVVTKYVFVPKQGAVGLGDNQKSINNNVNDLPANENQNLGNELTITEVVDKVSPSVVSIIVSKEIFYRQASDPFADFFPFGLPFNIVPPGYEGQNPDSGQKSEKKQIGGGTGFIISKDGLILTNKHVVSDEQATYSVVTNSGKKYDAVVVDRDPINDLAILKISADNLPAVAMGDSSKIKVGQTVVAIGYALGEYSNSVTRGIVSGLGRDIVAGDGTGSSESLLDVIQTDAAINPGNSGGPLINLYGEVIGINTAVNRSGQLVGFAIPVNTAKPVISSVIKNGRIVRPYLGVRYVLLNQEIAEKNNIAITSGALILRGNNMNELAVLANSPASKAGLKEGDVIMSVNDVAISEKQPLANLISNYQPGQKINLKIWRDGQEMVLEVLLAEMKNS
jgi:serine protease Do